MRNKSGREDRNAVSLCVVSVIGRRQSYSCCHSRCQRLPHPRRAVCQERLILFHNAVSTHPGSRLHSEFPCSRGCIPVCHATFDPMRPSRTGTAQIPSPCTSCTTELRIVTWVLQVLSAATQNCHRYHDANPFPRVVGGHAIHQHIVRNADRHSRERSRPAALLILHFRATNIVYKRFARWM